MVQRSVEPEKAVHIVEIARLLACLDPEYVATLRARITIDLLGSGERLEGQRKATVEETAAMVREAPPALLEAVAGILTRNRELRAMLDRIREREAAEKSRRRRTGNLRAVAV